MKNKDRIRMLLHPEQYTDEQLDQMLDETSIPVPDVEEGWRQFQEKHRLAALSGITYAAIQHFRNANDVKENTPAVAPQQKEVQEMGRQETEYHVAPIAEKIDSIRQDQQFNNVELQQIMQQLSRDYDVKVVFKNEAKRTLRFYLKWEANDSIQDILNRINHFEKVHLTLSGETITIE